MLGLFMCTRPIDLNFQASWAPIYIRDGRHDTGLVPTGDSSPCRLLLFICELGRRSGRLLRALH